MIHLNHISTKSYFRNPLGAVKCGESIRIRINSPKSLDAVYFILENDGQYLETGMTPLGERTIASGEIVYPYEATITAPDVHGVCYYSFKILDGAETFFVGCNSERNTGGSYACQENPRGFQLTVYDETFATPKWCKEGVMYQIFPDRFKRGNIKNLNEGLSYHRSMGRRVYKHVIWNERPIWKPIDGCPHYDPIDYYGGDLRGIIKALPELADMGISIIYLNPIVEAASNHRYNTADYYRVDPILGDNEDFKELCSVAKMLGIRIVIDGVFSHTGSDSRYFNKNNNYDELGAYQSKDSKYYSWYKFGNSRDEYKSWWGFDTLPEVNELDPIWQDMVVTGENSVIKHWLRLGASGVRLDVADELPDEVIDLMRDSLKEEDSDNFLIGEVWEDATTKFSYGKRREYCLGAGLDSVMNYPLRKAIIAYLNGHINCGDFANFLLMQQNNYPVEMYYSLMNLLSSHDVSRIKTVLGTDNEGDGWSREEQGRYVMSKLEEARGEARMRLAYGLVFSLPGIPCIYYGDEQGMTGFKDPFNREPYVETGSKLKKELTNLVRLRNSSAALKRGAMSLSYNDQNVILVIRSIQAGKDVFGDAAKDGIIVSAFNPNEEASEFDFRLEELNDGLQVEDRENLRALVAKDICLLLGDGSCQVQKDGEIVGRIPAMQYMIFEVMI